MATLRYARSAIRDLERLAGFLHDSDPKAAQEAIPLIVEGLRLLTRHPLIGRPLERGRRELVIFRGRSGYLARYKFLPDEDLVLVLGIRHQRELDG
ncbi:MAG TPA: type II toxin-antitoxin system RelE/ParE family toxin [Usitatibacter sp.]|nr:type II toxin-antitoxin system RelE/ParE family toxin [Usitatibacter sp.]